MGRTKVHANHCPFLGQHGRHICHCSSRFSAGTVDTVIGKLRSIFNSLDCTGDWDQYSCRGNPAAHHSIKAYLRSIQLEQAQAQTAYKQATPLFLDNFQRLIGHFCALLQKRKIPPSDCFVYARDLAVYARDLAFFTLFFIRW